MATTPNTLTSSEYWISPDALTIELNALDNPQYLQVSLLAGTVITAFRQGVIDYDASLNYRKWNLQAYNNFFDRTDRAYVYAQLDKNGNNALIIYSYDVLELIETITEDSGETRDVYNVFLATISPSINSNGESVFRTWEKELDTGGLSTDKVSSEWKGFFEKRTDSKGNSYLYTEFNLVSRLGITAYGSSGFEVPSIFDGIPWDNTTIWKNPETGLIEVIGGTGGGSDFDATAMWAALSAATSEQINKSHLTDALSGYALQTSLDEVSTKLNDFLEGSDTDTIINKWKELEAFLEGMSETDNLAEILSNKADTSYVNDELAKYVTLATDQSISGAKTFTSLLTTAAITASGDISTPNVRTADSVYINGIRLYKSADGTIKIDGNLLVTGGITAYSTGDEGSSGGGGGIDVEVLWEILGGTGTQQINITHLTGALTWNNISNKPSWIGDTKPSYTWSEIGEKPSWIGTNKPSYNWSEIGSKPTTLGGYGITDAYTKTDSDNRFASKEHNHPYLPYQDTRNENYSPYDNNFNERGLSATHLKTNTVDGLNDGGMYHASVYLYPWGDPSGGAAHNLAFTDNGNMWLRSGTSSWNSWKKLAFTTDNVASATNADKVDNYHAGNSSGQVAVSNGTVCTNLNADLLDGLHESSFSQINDFSFTNNIHVADWVKANSNTQRAGNIFSVSGWSWAGDSTLKLTDSISITRMRYSALSIRNGNLNAAWQQQALLFLPTYDDYMMYLVQMNTNDTSSSLQTRVKRYADYDTIINGNVYSATKLQTARTIWGQSFDGTEDVNGTLSGAPAIELYYSTPYIDFHYNNSTDDYTSRIIEIGSGLLQFTHNVIVSGNVGIGTTSPTRKLDVNGDIIASSWLRTRGQAGWYSETYDGGWYMIDSNWIRAYNDKSIYTAGVMQARNGFEATNSSILRFTPYTNKNVIDWSWNTTYGDHIKFSVPGTNPQNVYMILSSATGLNLWGNFTANGNILSTGGITCYSSDQRAKTVIEQISLSLKQIANAPTIRFKWNDWKIKDDGKTHIGGIAQYMQKLLPETVLEADDMLNMDYATTGYIFAVQTAKYLVKTDTEVEKLKKRVKKLEKQLKQLGYEETDIMDD